MDLRLTEEQDALIQTAREFTRKEIIPKAGHWDETGEFPKDVMKKAWETGLMNVEGGERARRDAAAHRRQRRAEEEVPRPPHRRADVLCLLLQRARRR